MKITWKLHIHKTRKDKILKAQKFRKLKMLKPKQQINPKLKFWLNLYMIKRVLIFTST